MIFIYNHHLTYLFFTILSVIGVAWISFWMKYKRKIAPPPSLLGVLILILVPGWFLVNYAENQKRQQIQEMMQGFTATYAHEMSQLGHGQVRLTDSYQDPLYLKLIQTEIDWLKINPLISDVYTLRKNAQNEIVLLVDSETDYNRNGRYDSERESRTPIGKVYSPAGKNLSHNIEKAFLGNNTFVDEPYSDPWGKWISAFSPILDSQGRVESVLGVDYAADSWIQEILMSRLSIIGFLLAIEVTAISAVIFIGILREDLRYQKTKEEEKNHINQQLQSTNVLLEQKIIELNQANQTLLNTQQQLLQSQKLESIGKLAGGIAHDFNNLLGAILGYAGLLKEELKDHPLAIKRLDVIQRSVERGAELTKQMLGFARKGSYQKNRINLNDSVIEARNLLYRAIDKTISIRCVTANDLWSIEGDPSQVLQIFMNLGVNARDAMPDGGELLIETQNIYANELYCQFHPPLKTGTYVKVSFSDTGLGIEDSVKEKIFDPFFTTKEVGKGTGLGLAMVYGIMENHQGSVLLDSEVGHGATFSLYFPAPDVPKSLFLNEPFQGNKRGPFLKGKTILVVEDESVSLKMIESILAEYGAHTLAAKTGERALHILTHENIDGIVLDWVLPQMDGLKLFREIRKLNSEVKIIIASANNEDALVCENLGWDNVDFVLKPLASHDWVTLLI